jgi:hypothetical protein
MIRRAFRFLVETRLLHMVGGLAIGLAGAGIAALILNYVVQPLSYRATEGMRAQRSQELVLWYWDESPRWETRDQVDDTLRSTYAQLLEALDVDDASIPKPINVLIHDSLDLLTASVVQRKSTLNEQRLTAPMDLLAGQDPTGPLTELIAAYGWGECRSQILQAGLRAALSEPDRDFHAIVAAAGSARLSLDRLLDAEGDLRPSLYQQYASPFSSSMVGTLTDIAGLMQAEDVSTVPLSDLAALHAASLVRYIVTEYGMTALRRAWGTGSTQRLLRRLDVPLDALDQAWGEAIRRAGEASPQIDYFRAYYDLLQGRTETAYAQILGWDPPHSADERALAIRAALLVGDLATARAYLPPPGTASAEELSSLVARFDGWTAVLDGRCRVLAPIDQRLAAERVAIAGWRAIEAVLNALGLEDASLPERITLVLYPSEAARDQEPALLPGADDAALLEVTRETPVEEIEQTLAELAPEYGYGARSSSRLVRSGVATAVLRPRETLIDHACGLIAENAWIWLERLDFNRSDIENVLVEAGLLFRYVLDTWGPEAIAQIWAMTARQPRPASLETALETACGVGRKEIEDALLATVLRCP